MIINWSLFADLASHSIRKAFTPRLHVWYGRNIYHPDAHTERKRDREGQREEKKTNCTLEAAYESVKQQTEVGWGE